METRTDYGRVNGHLLGIAMKEVVRRALSAIRNERFSFSQREKTGYDGESADLVTTADGKAQEIYLRSLRECFPNIGVIAEEENLSIEAAPPTSDLYFTVDPLDGTKAFARRQSTGIGTMLALINESEVLGAFVGDVMTQEVYGYRPGSSKVHRISEFEVSERLKIDPTRQAADQYILLRERPETHSAGMGEVIDAFKGLHVGGGSIGTEAARLWKGEVGAMLLPPSFETPWDTAPILGISRALGLQFYILTERKLRPFAPPFTEGPVWREEEVLVLHESRVEEIESLLDRAR